LLAQILQHPQGHLLCGHRIAVLLQERS
jgi:hypothetical protein